VKSTHLAFVLKLKLHSGAVAKKVVKQCNDNSN